MEANERAMQLHTVHGPNDLAERASTVAAQQPLVPETIDVMSSDGEVLLRLPAPATSDDLATLLADVLHASTLRHVVQACDVLRPLLTPDVPTIIDLAALRATVGPLLEALQQHRVSVRRFRRIQRRQIRRPRSMRGHTGQEAR
jgi:hypothetical protein